MTARCQNPLHVVMNAEGLSGIGTAGAQFVAMKGWALREGRTTLFVDWIDE